MSENLPIPVILIPDTKGISVSDNILTLEGENGINLIGGLKIQYDNISSGIPTFEIEDKHHLVEISNSSTNIVKLPEASGRSGKLFIIYKNYIGGSLNIQTQVLDNIDGTNSIELNRIYERISLISSGGNSWLII
jgi:hypothetical protein